MNVINWIYIIDDAGATIFSFENQVQGAGSGTSAVLSHFLYALQSIAKTLKDNEVRSVEMSNNRFFLCKEKMTNYLFIIKTNRDADAQIITPVLSEIKNKFVDKFTGHFTLVIEDKIALINSFREDIRDLLQQKSNIEKFADTL
jgi:hypothetical protein